MFSLFELFIIYYDRIDWKSIGNLRFKFSSREEKKESKRKEGTLSYIVQQEGEGRKEGRGKKVARIFNGQEIFLDGKVGSQFASILD